MEVQTANGLIYGGDDALSGTVATQVGTESRRSLLCLRVKCVWAIMSTQLLVGIKMQMQDCA